MGLATLQLGVRDLGLLPYAKALALQQQVHQEVLARRKAATVLFCEHDPVITVTARRGAERHICADSVRLARLGIDLQPTDRGGDVTYHGPGQIVAYPILRLAEWGLNVSRYMRLLEQVVMQTLGVFEISGQRVAGETGVWVGDGGAGCPAEAGAKICAMGIRVRKNVTMHGLALNVRTRLEHFQTIIPCGLPGCRVTSMSRLLGDRCPSMQQVKDELLGQMRSLLVP